MKKFSIILIVFSLFCLNISAQHNTGKPKISTKDWYRAYFKNSELQPDKKICFWKYNINGNISQEVRYKDNDSVFETDYYKYDEKNRKTEDLKYQDDGQIAKNILYHYMQQHLFHEEHKSPSQSDQSRLDNPEL